MDAIRFMRARTLRPRSVDGEVVAREQHGAPCVQPTATIAKGADRLHIGGGLAPALLGRTIEDAVAVLAEVRARTEPGSADELVDAYAAIGRATVAAEAVLLSSLDALDDNSGGGRARPAAPFEHLRARAFAVLREAGVAFDGLKDAFTTIVHASAGWPRQPVPRTADRGDGRPLFVYRNTFKKSVPLAIDEQRAEYRSRVEKFEGKGGRFADIIVADRTTFAKLDALVAYDYVLAEDGTLRLFPTLDTDAGAAKPGHSLLAEGSRAYTGQHALLAGELWVIKDSAGDVEAVLLANNSGHFKPEFADLTNALPHLAALGIPAEKVVLFGGPNNLPSMFAEIEERCGITGLAARLPPEPSTLLDEMANATQSALSVRL